MTRRTCAELGVCHGRPTMGCTCSPNHNARAALPPDDFFFAPGAIEHAPRKRRGLRASTVEALGRAVLAAAACAALAAAIGFSAGWLSVKGPLL